MTNSEESILIKQIVNGSKQDYRILVEKYHKGLIGYLYNMVHDEMLAQDIAQEAFVKALKSIDSYDDKYSFSTWLYKIASNIGLRHLEQQKNTSEVKDNIIDESQDPQLLLDEKMLRQKMNFAIKTLEPKYQMVVNLFYFQDRSYEEISLILEKPIGTIRTWLSRSKSQLRESMYEYAK